MNAKLNKFYMANGLKSYESMKDDYYLEKLNSAVGGRKFFAFKHSS